MENQRDFCTECRRETNYTLKKIKINQTIREKEYTFEITAAFCNECGGEMGVPGLMDYNIKEIDEQYRKASDNIGGYAIINNSRPAVDHYGLAGRLLLYLYLRQMEFLFQRILKDAGKVDVCRFSGIVEPAGNGKGFLYRSVPLFVLFHIERHHHHKIFRVNVERGGDRRLRADFAIFQHKADGILCHADSFVHGIALGEAALNIGDLNRVPGFFRVKNCRIENSVHNVTSFVASYTYFTYLSRGKNSRPATLRSRWAAYFLRFHNRYSS